MPTLNLTAKAGWCAFASIAGIVIVGAGGLYFQQIDNELLQMRKSALNFAGFEPFLFVNTAVNQIAPNGVIFLKELIGRFIVVFFIELPC